VIEASPGAVAQEFAQRVIRECESSLSLGAYASDSEANYVFADPARGVYELTFPLGAARRLHAVSGGIPALAWDEREMAQDRGVAFDSLPDSRPLWMYDGQMPTAILAHGEGIMHFVVGPVHAGIIEPGRFTLSSGGETVVHIDAQLGYAHRGVERSLEGKEPVVAARNVARICGSCSAARSYAYATALEQLAGIEISDEAQLARMILLELERVWNHLGDLAASSSGAGFNPGFTRGLALKERVLQLCARISGHRFLFDAIVPGGVTVRDLDIVAPVQDLVQEIDAYMRSLFGNASLLSRWQRTGIVTHEVARAYRAVGPANRGSRGEVDLRSYLPYGAYRELKLRSAHARSGDVLARCTVKRQELAESLRLICEALRKLGVRLPGPPLQMPELRGRATTAVEGPRGAEVAAVQVGMDGRLQRVHLIAASFRNWPLVARAMDGNIVPDFPLVNKSFNLCYACADR
jgi:Ni,Fe-hydrogenase III large subunit